MASVNLYEVTGRIQLSGGRFERSVISHRALCGLILVWVLLLLRYHYVFGISWFKDDFLFLDLARQLSFSETWGFRDAIGNAYRPLTRNVYFWMGREIAGHNPVPYHVFNLAVALSGLLLCFVVFRHLIAGAEEGGRRRKAPQSTGGAFAAEGPALLGTFLFAAHPAAATPLTWVCGIQDLLAVALVLAAAYAHLTRRRILYTLCFMGAVLSKEPAVFLPGILWFYDRVVLGERPGIAARRQLIPLVFVAFWLVCNRWLPWNDLGATIHAEPGKPSPLGRADLHTLIFTFRSLLLLEPIRGFEWRYGIPATIGMVALSVAVLAVVQTLHWPKRGNLWLVVVGILWSASSILPVMAVNSHFVYYAYYPALGALLAVVAALIVIARWVPKTAQVLTMLISATLAGLLTIGAGYKYDESHHDAHSIRRGAKYLQSISNDLKRMHPRFPPGSRSYFWKIPAHIGFLVGDGQALRVWYDDAGIQARFLSEYHPDSSRPSFFFLHDENGRLVEIVPGAADPYMDNPPTLYADGLTDLGTCFVKNGELEAALTEWKKAIKIQPNHAIANANLGILLVQMGRYNEAVSVLERAVLLDPGNAGARLHLDVALENLGQHSARGRGGRRPL